MYQKTGGTFGGFKRHVPGKAIGDNHINRALGKVITFDKTFETDWQIDIAQDRGRLFDP